MLHLLQQRCHDVPVNPCTLQELRHHSRSYHIKCRLDVKIAQGQCALMARAWHRHLFSCFPAIPCVPPRKMCDHDLQVFSVQHVLGAHREIVALHGIVLFLQKWYHRCRIPRRKHGLLSNSSVSLHVRFLDECQALHFSRFKRGAFSPKSLVKPMRDLVGKFRWQGFEHLRTITFPRPLAFSVNILSRARNNMADLDPSIFLPHFSRYSNGSMGQLLSCCHSCSCSAL